MKTILMTGAAGGVGSHLRRELAAHYRFVLSDIQPIVELKANETFIAANLTEPAALAPLMHGIDSIIHLGGFSVEGDWNTILQTNIIGTHNLFEAARHARVKRLIFASSNHAVGFYQRDQIIDDRVVPKPDSRYGVSKVFGEALASLYADKYGMQMLCMRIGNVHDRPLDRRRLAIWCSPRDLAQLTTIGIEHPDIRFEIVYGCSDNARAWWDNGNARRRGYHPQDRSEDYATEILAREPAQSNDARADQFQGGAFVSAEVGGDPFKNDQGAMR